MGKAFEESFYKRRRFCSSPPYSYNRAAGGRKSRIEGSYQSFLAIPERPLLAVSRPSLSSFGLSTAILMARYFTIKVRENAISGTYEGVRIRIGQQVGRPTGPDCIELLFQCVARLAARSVLITKTLPR